MRKYSCSGPTVVKTRFAASSPSSLRARIAAPESASIERLPRPRGERRGDAEQRPVGVLEDEGRRGRVPGGVAAGLEGRADPAGGEGRGVGLALDQLLAGEVRER